MWLKIIKATYSDKALFLTAACCPKRDFYTHTPPPLKNGNVLHTQNSTSFCTAYSKKHTKKSAKKSQQKKVGKKRRQIKSRPKKVGKKGGKKVYS